MKTTRKTLPAWKYLTSEFGQRSKLVQARINTDPDQGPIIIMFVLPQPTPFEKDCSMTEMLAENFLCSKNELKRWLFIFIPIIQFSKFFLYNIFYLCWLRFDILKNFVFTTIWKNLDFEILGFLALCFDSQLAFSSLQQ